METNPPQGPGHVIQPPKERSSLDLVDKCEEMMGQAYEFIRHFPKHQQHSLGADIRETMTRLLHLVYRCARRFHKKTTLEDLIVEIDFLRSQVRVAYNSRFIDVKKYTKWAAMNDEIGRMIGGWYKRLQEANEKGRGKAENRRHQ
ncbi:diversity-generating retroelement protein Avd [Vreelandella aquamarina]|uniref:diversity-generating retroelement protein Avd n=1 Tax=Vreelandella aquamarina TaxID=77097 RepID=UPI000A048179|nr:MULTISPECIES: diversity-generating retroelement protein Avd [Halomonas]MDK2751211.1 diversity-generating retroelement protein Avd [Halomonas meridiana]